MRRVFVIDGKQKFLLMFTMCYKLACALSSLMWVGILFEAFDMKDDRIVEE